MDTKNESEFVIGLVAAVGTNLEYLSITLKEIIESFNYNVVEIRISKEIIEEISKCDIPNDSFGKIDKLMSAGNDMRERTKNNAILSLCVASYIASKRTKENGLILPKKKTAYIIRSLKHPEEVDLLKNIYANGFYLLGIYEDEEKRLNFLTQHKSMSIQQAEKLIKRDMSESEKWGQHTRDTYELSDFFINYDNNYEKVTNQLWRFFDLLFGNPYVTPTFDEYAMSMAYLASLRSADLSRQVGAVITKHKMILATGANDVPKFGGGLYWPEMKDNKIQDIPDGRDHVKGYDSNAKEKETIISDIINDIDNELSKNSLVNSKKNKIMDIVSKALRKSKIKDITEYGRMVHAEMDAILSCARLELNTYRTTLYCTTFPCHNCAKHIVASGIKRVVYVEPYPKSKALNFHSDSIISTIGKNVDRKNLLFLNILLELVPEVFLIYFQ